MAGAVNMENLLLSLKGELEYLDFPLGNNIEPVPLVPLLEDQLSPAECEFFGKAG